MNNIDQNNSLSKDRLLTGNFVNQQDIRDSMEPEVSKNTPKDISMNMSNKFTLSDPLPIDVTPKNIPKIKESF